MGEPKTRQIEKRQYGLYLQKAKEFYLLMKHAEKEQLWSGVGLSGVHCAISLCDALTTFYLGIRSVSPKHNDAVVLLCRIQEKEFKEKASQLGVILSVKNQVEYEAREFRKKDAERISKQTERLYRWTLQKLPI